MKASGLFALEGRKTDKQRFFQAVLTVACFMLMSATAIYAQGTRGSIRGVVTDPNGAVVPGALVRMFDVPKNQELRSVQTNNKGEYQLLEVEPATYDIVISAAGFSET